MNRKIIEQFIESNIEYKQYKKGNEFLAKSPNVILCQALENELKLIDEYEQMINRGKDKKSKVICARIIDKNNSMYRGGKLYKNAGFAKSGIRPSVCSWIKRNDFDTLKTTYIQTVYENGYIEKEPLIYYSIDIVKKEIKETDSYLKMHGTSCYRNEKDLMTLEDVLKRLEEERDNI